MTTICEKHEWQVIDTSLSNVALNVQCSNCGECGVVDDPTSAEWARAHNVPNRRYHWDDDDRVRLRKEQQARDMPPHMAEALHLLWECVDAGKPAPTEIELELEDDNAITWTVEGLLESAEACPVLLAKGQFEEYGLPSGSSYADFADHISQIITCNAECSFEILETLPARFPKRKDEPLPEGERSVVYSDDMRSANARWEGRYFLTEPVFRDGKATGEVRVYRISIPRSFCLVPSSKIPWHAVLPNKEAADEWVQRVIKEEKQ